MSAVFGYLLAVLAALVGMALAWRLVSRWRHLPCPSSLSWFVENRLMERVAGSALLLERAGVAPGMRVLDVGCGPGRLTLPAARRVGPSGEVVGLDIQPEMLRRVRDRAAAAGLANVRLVEAPAGAGRVGERDAFDRALLVTVLGEIPDRAAALAEIFAAPEPGGVLSVTEVLPDPHYQRPATVRRLGEAAGFQVGERFGHLGAFTLNLAKPGGDAG
jgi:ubiquinone/menaquinone biosynthesis C-methylase UbiE